MIILTIMLKMTKKVVISETYIIKGRPTGEDDDDDDDNDNDDDGDVRNLHYQGEAGRR